MTEPFFPSRVRSSGGGMPPGSQAGEKKSSAPPTAAAAGAALAGAGREATPPGAGGASPGVAAAAAPAPAPRVKSTSKIYKLTDLEKMLRGECSGKKKSAFGLSLATKKHPLERPASKKRRLGALGPAAAPAVDHRGKVLQRRGRDENNSPAAFPSSVATGEKLAPRRKTYTEKIKAKRPLAVAAAAAAQEAGWYDMPGPAVAAGRCRHEANRDESRPARGAQAKALEGSITVARSKTETSAAPAQAQAASRRKPVSMSASSSEADGSRAAPGTDAPRSQRLHRLHLERSSAAAPMESQPRVRPAAKTKTSFRTGLMDEFFPRLTSQSQLPGRGGVTPPRAPVPVPPRDNGGNGDGSDSAIDADSDPFVSVRHELPSHLRRREHGKEGPNQGGRREWNRDSLRGNPSGSGGDTGSTERMASEFTGSGSVVGSASTEVVSVAARSTARSEIAAKAALAAERRAVATALAGEGERSQGASAVAAMSGADVPEAGNASEDLEKVDETATSGTVATAEAATAEPPPASDILMDVLEEVEEIQQPARQEVDEGSTNSAWPCRRRRGAASLFLSQRQRTGGLRWRGVGVGEAGNNTFRRQALSTVLANGLRIQRLRMGRTSNSRIGGGVVRGHPESQSVRGRVAGGVSCMEFDSVGWQLAVGGENVTVYDFDRYLPENARLKHTLSSGERAYLQPTDGIQTKRTVSCIRWNPANAEQLAVSYLNYDEIEVYDLRRIHPNGLATPVLTLLPGTGSAAVAAAAPASRSGGAFGRARVSSGGGGGGGGGGGSGSSSSLSGKFRGLGNLDMEFLRRGPPDRKITHLVAGGRGGVFRAWRFFPERARLLAPYLQGQVGYRGAPRPDVAAVCCLNPDVALAGTSSGQLAAFSLDPPVVKTFGSSKNADQKKTWYLGASSVWGDADPPCAPNDLDVRFLRLSPDNGAGVVLCGLRSGRVVIFDTSAGRALGITEPHRGASVGFCLPPAAASVPPAHAATAFDEEADQTAPLKEGEGATEPYGGGHWGPVLLACCESSSGGGQGDGELVVLSTSARAELDCGSRRGNRRTTRPGRHSGLRPGRGWELGEAGGGGFRVEVSEGYHLCLPVEVVAATPGQNRVLLSADARGYLCSRAERRLLRSGLVTSSIMIGGEKHSVEAVNDDGTVLVLDRKYAGPPVAVEPTTDEEGRPRPGRVAGGRDGAQASSPLGLSSPNVDRLGAVHVDPDSELDVPEPLVGDGADYGGQSYSRQSQETETAAAPQAAQQGRAGRRATATAKREPSVGQTGPVSSEGGGASAAAAATTRVSAAATAAVHPGQIRQQVSWRPAWRPGRVRVFAKLKAVFDDGGDDGAIFRARRSGMEAEEEWQDEDGEGAPPFSLYQVVARAGLGQPVTAITSHPRMNFVLVGLSDGTVATVLPQGRTSTRASSRARGRGT